jgi:hypothetical protein
MKLQKLLFASFFLLLHCTGFGQKPNTQNSSLRTTSTTQLSLPGKEIVYGWNGKNWRINQIIHYLYDAKGRQIAFFIKDTFDIDTFTRRQAIYDANGSQFGENSNKTSGIWDISYRDTFLRDGKGFGIKDVGWSWDKTFWTKNYAELYNNTYDSKGYLTTQQHIGYSKDTSENDFVLNSDGSWMQVVFKYSNKGKWSTTYKLDSLTWHNWGEIPRIDLTNYNYGIFYRSGNSRPEKYIEQLWNGSVWRDTLRHTFTYDANMGYVEVTQKWKFSKWVLYERVTVGMDSHNQWTGYIDELWDGKDWTLIGGNGGNEKALITYNTMNDLIQQIYQVMDYNTYKYTNFQKYVYTDFIYVTGIENAAEHMPAFKIYPNPTSGIVNLQIEMASNAKVSILVHNLKGQLVLQRQVNALDFTAGVNLDVSTCPKGMYFIKAATTEGEIHCKFIKE